MAESARVLRPNGKLAIIVMMVPIEQTPEAKRRKEPRRLHDLAHDFQQRILAETDLRLFEKFIWAKQTTERMQGAYPTPGNSLACNTPETITVFVKPGARRSYRQAIRDANGMKSPERLTRRSSTHPKTPSNRKFGSPYRFTCWSRSSRNASRCPRASTKSYRF
jgi:hypothetical protein